MALEKDLATPETQSDIDKVRMYIKEVNPDCKRLRIELHKGFLNSGIFEVVKVVSVTVTDTDYDTILDTEGEVGVAVRVTLASAIWNWLETNEYVTTV